MTGPAVTVPSGDGEWVPSALGHPGLMISVQPQLDDDSRLPSVRLSVETDDATVVGKLDTRGARRIAMSLLDAAARADWQYDLVRHAKRAGLDDGSIEVMLRWTGAS